MCGGLPHGGHRERRLGGRAGRCRAGLDSSQRGGEWSGMLRCIFTYLCSLELKTYLVAIIS